MGNVSPTVMQQYPQQLQQLPVEEQEIVASPTEMNLNSIMKIQNTSIIEWNGTGHQWEAWPEPVFYKLFLDPEGRHASLTATKVEIWSRNFFSEEITTIFRAKYIGGKRDRPGNMFLFDIMKSNWEQMALEGGNMEVNMDIVLSHAPLMRTCITLVSYIELQQRFLTYSGFQGTLNVMVRFAHPCAWDVKDLEARAQLIGGTFFTFESLLKLYSSPAEAKRSAWYRALRYGSCRNSGRNQKRWHRAT